MAKNKMKWYDWTAIALLIIGGINWGFVGFFNWNLVHAIFGAGTWITNIIYDLVGISAIYSIYSLWKIKD